MEVASALVTGANRGIGLEFVRQLVQLPQPPKYVFATFRSRDSVKALEDIAVGSPKSQVVLIKMDVTKVEEVVAARQIIEDMVKDVGLTLLINNAAVSVRQGFPEITEENMLYHFTTNTVGPVTVFKEMFPLLQKSAARKTSGMCVSRAAVLNISSVGASIGLTVEQPIDWLASMSSRITKTALNMAMRVASQTVKDQGILVVQMCPGWVKTDLGTDYAPLEASESISAMLKTLSQLNESHQGDFFDRNGNTIPF